MPNFNISLEGLKTRNNYLGLKLQIQNCMDVGCSISKVFINYLGKKFQGFNLENPEGFSYKTDLRDIYLRQYESITIEPYFEFNINTIEITVLIETPLGNIEKSFAI